MASYFIHGWKHLARTNGPIRWLLSNGLAYSSGHVSSLSHPLPCHDHVEISHHRLHPLLHHDHHRFSHELLPRRQVQPNNRPNRHQQLLPVTIDRLKALDEVRQHRYRWNPCLLLLQTSQVPRAEDRCRQESKILCQVLLKGL